VAPSSYRAIGVALAIGGVIAFSFRPVLIKIAYGYVRDPVTLIALRMVFSLPFFLAAALWQRRTDTATPISRRDFWAILALGFIGYYFASFVDFLGLQYITAGLGRLVLFTYPTLVVILSWIFLRRRAGSRELTALGVTYVGLALVLAHAVSGQNENLPLGTALVFASAVSYAIYLVVGGQVIQRVGSIRFTAYALLIACGLCIAQFLLLRPLEALALPWQVYAAAIAMAIFSTVLPTFMTAEALKRIGANQVAILGALGPVSTIVAGWLGFEETMSAPQLAGTALVLCGVVLVSLKPRA
jgi:drug/metabolite transporter (DMT)-like permease